MPSYASLSKIVFTPEQDTALAIEWKTLKNDKRVTTESPEEELADRVLAIMQDLEVKHANPVKSPELRAKADEAILNGQKPQTDAYIAFMLQTYGVDLTPTIPPDKP